MSDDEILQLFSPDTRKIIAQFAKIESVKPITIIREQMNAWARHENQRLAEFAGA